MNRTTIRTFFAALISFFLIASVYASGVDVSTVTLVDHDTGGNTWDIRYNISWNNSWRDTGAPAPNANWDAVWIFCKYSVKTGAVWGDWQHCKFKNTGSIAPAGSTITFADNNADGIYRGAFIYRSTAGAGINNWTGAEMRWDYGADGVADDAVVKLKIFAIEMVYIPEGPFYIGDGSASPRANFRWADGTIGAVLITNALGAAFNGASTSNSFDDTYMKQGAGAPGNGAGIRIDGDGGIYDSTGTLINASFPTGYNAFYIMKYEVSQGQYKDFLNTLTRAQQNTRTASQAASYYTMSAVVNVKARSGIRNPASIPSGVITFINDLEGITAYDTTTGDGIGNESNDGQWLAANFVSWMDAAAFADWAALRPFTELEFEKACRGVQVAVPDEYAWGNATVETATTSLTNSGTSSEAPNQGNMNYTSGTPEGVFRVGSFADGNSTRQNAGASYYGVLDLSGNATERPVTVGGPQGRAFAGTMGDGVLSVNGNANNSDWPGYITSEVTGPTGAGLRGGSWQDISATLRVSDRVKAAEVNVWRNTDLGMRSARTSP